MRKIYSLTVLIARIAAPVLFSLKRVNIFARYWLITIRQSTGNLWVGKRGQTAGAIRYVLEKQELKKPWMKGMNNKLTARQRRHLAAIKELPCGVCGACPPSDAHHIEQHLQYLCVPLCKDCHQGSFNGIHGQRRIWNVMKKTELTVLNDTIEKLQK